MVGAVVRRAVSREGGNTLGQEGLRTGPGSLSPASDGVFSSLVHPVRHRCREEEPMDWAEGGCRTEDGGCRSGPRMRGWDPTGPSWEARRKWSEGGNA